MLSYVLAVFCFSCIFSYPCSLKSVLSMLADAADHSAAAKASASKARAPASKTQKNQQPTTLFLVLLQDQLH